MRTALVVPGTGQYVRDILLLELPHFSDDDREFVLWEYTGWPHFWDYQGREWYPTHTLRRQLREFRDGKAVAPAAFDDLSGDLSGDASRVLGGAA